MSRPMPYTTDDRTVIPCYCWIRDPETGLRCTLRPHEAGDHFNMRKRVAWKNRGPEPQ